jgi:hypothetical protein
MPSYSKREGRPCIGRYVTNSVRKSHEMKALAVKIQVSIRETNEDGKGCKRER